MIWSVRVLNAVIRYVQEAKAKDATASLAKTVTTEAAVLQDAQTLQVPSLGKSW